MKFLFCVVLFFGACDNSVKFEVPQPKGVKNESGIPSNLIGTYKHVTDSARLTITHNLIVKATHTKNIFPKSELDSAETANIHGDQLQP